MFGEVSEAERVNLTAAKPCRVSRVPAKLSNFVREDKVSGHCPGCRAPVKTDDKGVVCEKCKAYWHYECAEVTQQEIDTVWKEEFFCKAHRSDTKDQAQGNNNKVGYPTQKMMDNNNGGDQVLVNIKINSYTMDKASKLKFKLNNMELKANVSEKACHRQYTIKVNSVTYQILVENFINFGERLGVKPKRFDVDRVGDILRTSTK